MFEFKHRRGCGEAARAANEVSQRLRVRSDVLLPSAADRPRIHAGFARTNQVLDGANTPFGRWN